MFVFDIPDWIMPTLSKMLVLVAGTVLGTEILWRLVCLWRRRLTTCSKGETVEVLFFPDLPADLFFHTNSALKDENRFGANLSKVRRKEDLYTRTKMCNPFFYELSSESCRQQMCSHSSAILILQLL
jgi:hypothetical protein